MDKLAILGGKKAIQLEYENVGKVDEVSSEGIANAVKLMKKGEISISSITEKFEEKFAKYIETKYALTLNNGTSSLISALYAIGVGPGDEVIVPSFSFWATATCVHIMNAIPVFCDIDKDTYNMDACNIEKKNNI